MPEEVEDFDEDEDIARLKNAVAPLMEHFDTVQIFTTRHTNDGTEAYCWGGGNWYARRGQVGAWVIREDASFIRKSVGGE